MPLIDELKLSKELIKFPSVTPVDAGAIKFLSKKLKWQSPHTPLNLDRDPNVCIYMLDLHGRRG